MGEAITFNETDVKDTTLLTRLLRKMESRAAQYGDRLSRLESMGGLYRGAPMSQGTAMTLAQIRDALQATGSHPLNVQNLLGILAQTQPASVSYVTTSVDDLPDPSNLELGSVGIVNTGSPVMYVVTQGLPRVWTTISFTSTADMTTNTAQDVTGTKTWKVQQIFDLAGLALLVKPESAPVANTTLFQVQNSTGGNLLKVDSEGDTTVGASLTVVTNLTASGDATITGGLLVKRPDYGIRVQPSSTPAANELLFQVLSTGGLTRMSVDEDGDVVCQDLDVSGYYGGQTGVIRFSPVAFSMAATTTHIIEIICGNGTPESNITAKIGSIYMRRDGGAGTSFYVKESGTGSTGWVGK